MPLDPEVFAEMVVRAIDIKLAPIREQLAALGDVRDRLVALETKAAAPMPVLDIGDVRDRIGALEVKAATAADSSVLVETQTHVVELLTRVGEIAMMRERIAVLETRAPVPGPMGPSGEKGLDGKDGRNGTVDDLRLKCVAVSDRSFQLYAGDGVPIEDGLITMPIEIYRGVYIDGKTYDQGDCVTWAGSEWHCNDTTTAKPGDGSKAWTLKVKKGRDGKDGRDGRDAALPVVHAGGRT